MDEGQFEEFGRELFFLVVDGMKGNRLRRVNAPFHDFVLFVGLTKLEHLAVATSRGDREVFKLGQADEKNEVVKRRIYAAKTIAFHPIDDEKKQLTAKLLELALVHKDKQLAILIFVRSVEAIGTLVAALRKEKLEVQQLTGTLRGLERDRMADPRKTGACP